MQLERRREILMRETIEGSGEFVADGRGSPTPEVLARLVENHEAFLAFLRRGARDVTTGAAAREAEAATAWFYQLLRNALVDHTRCGSCATANSNA